MEPAMRSVGTFARPDVSAARTAMAPMVALDEGRGQFRVPDRRSGGATQHKGDNGLQAKQTERQNSCVTFYADLKCDAVRWVADEANPGWIEVVLRDAEGRSWKFFDKSSVFRSTAPILKTSSFPVEVTLLVAVVTDGDPTTVSTAPSAIESEEGEHLFRVSIDQLGSHRG